MQNQTFLDLASLSLSLINVVGSVGNASNADAQLALRVCNLMLDSWVTDRLFIPNVKATQWPLTPGQTQFSIGYTPAGPGQPVAPDFQGIRPGKINRANLIDVTTNPVFPIVYPLRVFDEDEWASIGARDIGVPLSIPSGIYYDYAYPIATITFYPSAPSTANFLELFTWDYLQQIPSVQEYIDLPQGYADAIVYSLAVRLAPHFGREASPTVQAKANEAVGRLQANNAPIPHMRVDSGLGAGRRWASSKPLRWLVGPG